MDMAKGLPGRIRRLLGPAAAGACILLTLTGCTGGGGSAPSGDAAASDDAAAVIAPGRPGEKARTLSPEEAARSRPDDSPNAADRAYMRHMVEHHEQAIRMTALAPDRAAKDAVKRLAERISAAQAPEIAVMRAWLARHPGPDGADGHDHGAMPGMATEQQLKDLEAARGTDFDRLFLSLMTRHHEGALTMAGEVLKGGNNAAVEELANEVVATQSAEIHRMRAMG
ncbi:DUF305 domain-containing protein [Streptomyces globosus]|uniref:DUF305 domain-containing protein n=1 Tax=Streptomyces globosus TaxID=68209 RepID=A0A344U9P2_9ACTN|nr:DUF305 domain-containing protein [Streptomyces globosus]AXE27613.1 DUF305 domain-containing protein [Streptomyces globosus]